MPSPTRINKRKKDRREIAFEILSENPPMGSLHIIYPKEMELG
jgi:hypothetical protein